MTHVSTAEMDLSFVDATTGQVLYRRNMTNAGTATTADTTGDQVWPFYYSCDPAQRRRRARRRRGPR